MRAFRWTMVVAVLAAWLLVPGTASAQYQPQPPPPGPSVTIPPVVAPVSITRPPAVAPQEVSRQAPAAQPQVLGAEVNRGFATTGSGLTIPAVIAAIALLAVGVVAVVSSRRLRSA